MFKLLAKKTLGPNLTQYEIHAPRIARSRHCGQFVMVRAFDHSERIPLTVADINQERGSITLIVQTVGKTTLEMSRLEPGQGFRDVAGPMGQPSHLSKYGHVVVIGGGLGTAVVYPQAVALKNMGNQITSIIGARTRDLLILQEQLGSVSDRLMLTTNDGSEGIKGFVTDALKILVEDKNNPVHAVYCAGPVVMMKAVADFTRPLAIPTIVSLNPVMVDGTGMCGGCRVTVNKQTKFACVDGPEFDGHQVNFAELMDRLTTYRDKESAALKQFEESHHCRLQP